MARPCKAMNTASGKIGKEEREARRNTENTLKGGNDKIKPSTYLNARQKKIFRYIVKELEEAGILGNLDVFILDKCAISIDRLRELEKKANENSDYIYEVEFRRVKDAYDKDFFRCCNELSLSPQSRAKLANINVQAQQEDPLLDILSGIDDDDD